MKNIFIKILLSVSLTAILSSCIEIKVVTSPIVGFNSGYSRLSDEEKEMVIFANCETVINKDTLREYTFYAVTGKQVVDMMRKSEKSLLYIWTPNCTAESCLPIENVYEEGMKKGYDVYIIAEYFSLEAIIQVEGFEHPVFVPNFLYYDTDRCDKYEKKFLIDVLGNDNFKSYWKTLGEPTYGRCLIFNNGDYSHSVRELDKL